MSDQQPSPRGVADRLRDARTAVRTSFARRPVPWIAGGLATVLVLGSGGAVAVAAATMPTPTTTAAATASATASSSPAPTTAAPTPTPTPSGRAVPDDAAGPSALRTCTITNAASASGLGAFEGYVMNAKTGEVLFSRNGDEAAQTGSVMKTLTTATALAVLGGDHRIPTTVTKESGGTIALVGHGDATLSAGGATVYPGAPTLAQLAQQVKAKLGNTPVTTIVTDDTYWNDADAWDPTWPVSERTIGYQPNVTALMVDGDRANPGAQTSPRSTDPVGRAGDLFRTALANAGVAGAGNAQIVKRATTSTDTIATVSSQPVSTLIGQMIPNSDNTLAEMLARISSKESGSDGSAASLTAVYQAALKSYGVDPAGIVIKDGSGESAANAVSPNFVAHLMVQVAAGAKGLGTLANALPVSGQSGTLASRFTGANAVARGKVHAKTGWIDSANTLGGYIDAADGTRLTFAFYAIGSSRAAALPALDAVTAATYSCGSRLTGS
ncbi:D-alanyl-D-alanine carboxypeptidase/D-alanyl-D-alanine-endopeptidase (penicillin-binding protein 4) [Curtobacterium sp. 320]|uniref:D-alanyl-D-alanine carboxypeptidase/D-alanyl-D-alanine endopeptidase n=1 Tax=Curtobacterium sp. 320 TaxID=2817749 RepID=UPI002863F2D5|nr:D-alanyl-D-alanine carboxypeptidase/D-alanyl-D-alanine-endopeptidase [Curtobacterium sp. 320]MDR6571904.1 D-alanyl-D-alanine carboxypeptidase/D-alanyl-D-alanine-endopeptidase (penicillin-binding protein 4) [Curtobacterium sp. 320]